MGAVATVVLDDVDVTELCVAGQVTRRLNRIGTASVQIQMKQLAELFGTMYPTCGSYLKIYFTSDDIGTIPELWFHGRVMSREITADKDNGYAVFNASDPMELWQHRPVRDDDGDFSLPQIIQTYEFAPTIIQAMFNNSIDTTIGGGGPPPTYAEGPLRLDLNSVAGGVKSVIGAPTDWPMTMAELTSLLVSTGVLDFYVTPIEFDAFDNYGQLDLYNGDFGNDLTGSVTLSYGMGDDNVQSMRWNTDMTQMCNKLWYYLGPRVGTADDPPGDQHWRANIQGDDPGLAYPPGGGLPGPCGTHGSTNNPLGVRSCISRGFYDVRMDIQIFDALGDEAVVAHDLFRRQWQVEQWIRDYPRDIVHVTPNRDFGIGLFNIGDLVQVEATTDMAGGISGGQRIYEFTIAWDANESVPAISELQVSSDNEGGSLSG